MNDSPRSSSSKKLTGGDRIYPAVLKVIKLVEIVLCLIGGLLLQYVYVFYNRLVYELLIIGTGGYLLICTNMVFSIMKKHPSSPISNIMFMTVGALLNVMAGILTLVRFRERNQDHFMNWCYVSLYYYSDVKHIDFGLGIVVVVSGFLMLADCILCCKYGLRIKTEI